MNRFRAAAEILAAGVGSRAFPGASVEVGRAGGPLWIGVFGRLTYEEDAPPVSPETIYDLASLTKVIATATLALRAVDNGALALDTPVAALFGAWRGGDREGVTVRDLLQHSSGLTAWLPLFRDHAGRADFEHAICMLPLEYAPRTRSIYSDLGFMLLGFVLDDLARSSSPAGAGRQGSSAGFQGAFDTVARSIGAEPLCFNPPRTWRADVAPTEHDPWRGRLLQGDVHDENAWALGGVAGHAGLFGTAAAVGTFARAVLRTLAGEPILGTPPQARNFVERSTVPGSSRALGWDTMQPTSSCGAKLSPGSIGHTGFTGTSLWIDWPRDLYVVLLTNRVYPSRETQGIRHVRPRLHDAVIDALG